MAIDKNKLIKVTNRYSGTVGYDVQDLAIPHRLYQPNETKEVTFEELEKVAATVGGRIQLKEHLVIKDYEAARELLPEIEPEYYYDEAKVKELLSAPNNYDAFLDCLDFAPDGVIDLIKKYAVELPVNDIAKRQAIREKTGFNVDAAIKIENTKLDGETEAEAAAKKADSSAPKRRTATPVISAEGAAAPKRRVVVTKD